MKTYTLSVTKRTVAGKKVKKLRKDGILPANIYGKDVKSASVQVPLKEFEKIYKQAGETSIVELSLDSEKRPVLIHNVQLDFLTRVPIHVDFYQVNLKEKVKTMIPLEIVGEPKAVVDKLGMLLQTLNEVEVEALPGDLPEKIEVDVTNLAVVNDQIIVSDLKKPRGVEILTDEQQVVAKISELVSKEAEEQQKTEEEKAAAEVKENEETPKEGQAPSAEKPQEQQKAATK